MTRAEFIAILRDATASAQNRPEVTTPEDATLLQRHRELAAAAVPTAKDNREKARDYGDPLQIWPYPLFPNDVELVPVVGVGI